MSTLFSALLAPPRCQFRVLLHRRDRRVRRGFLPYESLKFHENRPLFRNFKPFFLVETRVRTLFNFDEDRVFQNSEAMTSVDQQQNVTLA